MLDSPASAHERVATINGTILANSTGKDYTGSSINGGSQSSIGTDNLTESQSGFSGFDHFERRSAARNSRRQRRSDEHPSARAGQSRGRCIDARLTERRSTRRHASGRRCPRHRVRRSRAQSAAGRGLSGHHRCGRRELPWTRDHGRRRQRLVRSRRRSAHIHARSSLAVSARRHDRDVDGDGRRRSLRQLSGHDHGRRRDAAGHHLPAGRRPRMPG